MFHTFTICGFQIHRIGGTRSGEPSGHLSTSVTGDNLVLLFTHPAVVRAP